MKNDHDPQYVFPCIRARMGDWWYYVSVIPFRDVKSIVQKVDDIHERNELKTWIQRELRDDRINRIAEYLKTEQRFFNAIVVGIYGGDPDWFPLSVSANLAAPAIKLNELTSHSMGLLTLTGKEEIFAIDGQHRVEGIKGAFSKSTSLDDDLLTVIFVSHKESDEGRVRTRRLFFTLNKFANPVSAGELVALSEDDTFAIVTRAIIDESNVLDEITVPLTPSPNIPSGDEKGFVSVLALYSIVSTISLPMRDRQRKRMKKGPPNAQNIEESYATTLKYLTLLRKHFVAVKSVTGKDPKKLPSEYRAKSGGNMLFWFVGINAFTRAVRHAMDQGSTMEMAVKKLSKVPMTIDKTPWAGTLWNTTAEKIIHKHVVLAQNILLKWAGFEMSPKTFPLLEKYRHALDNRAAVLPPELS